MSSGDEGRSDDHSAANMKKRRVQRACDICRRKKIRCDGGQMPNNRCTNCTTYDLECTYVEAAKKRGPPKGYVGELENRLGKMERLLNKLAPGIDLDKELLDGAPFDKEAWLAEQLEKNKASKSNKKCLTSRMLAAASPQLSPSLPVENHELDPSDDESTARQTLIKNFQRMNFKPGGSYRFFGKSSSIMFLKTALDLKNQYNDEEPLVQDRNDHKLLGRKRQEFWAPHSWIKNEYLRSEPTHYEFPPEDLVPALIELYFQSVNDYMPLLHRPTFEKGVHERLHLEDDGFASTLLLVCALGARFSDDARALLEGTNDQHSAGWQWFRQVSLMRRTILAPPRLYDLQVACLMAMYLHNTSSAQAAWTVIGVGIRLAQDVGAHRRKVYDSKKTNEEELWKRSFWTLVTLDRFMSSTLGRSCAIQDEDFDLNLPVECDDEYWINDDHTLELKQPPGKPSKVAFFNCMIRLNQILAFALRTIYSINKSKAMLGFVGSQWEQHIVSELDSALNRFIDSIPDHLRWDPHREDMLFLNQSAFLYTSYYHLQIAVHRPFIPSPRKPSPLSFPSLAICTNAARSCVHVMDTQMKRSNTQTPGKPMAVFIAGIVLLLNIWGGKRSGLNINYPKEMEDVHKVMSILKALEPRWYTAGRLSDIISELVSAGDLPLPGQVPNNKRGRDETGSVGSSTAASTPIPEPSSSRSVNPEKSRETIGSRRVSQSAFQPQFQPQMTPQSQGTSLNGHLTHTNENIFAMNDFVLPMRSDELGSLPLHLTLNDVIPDGSNMFGSAFSEVPEGAGLPTVNVQTQAGPSSANIHPLAGSLPFDTEQAMYEQFFTNLTASLAPTPLGPTLYPTSIDPQRPPLPSEAIGNLMAATHFGDGLTSVQSHDVPFAQWSTGPPGFEWEDWGAYLTTFGGLGNLPNDAGGC